MTENNINEEHKIITDRIIENIKESYDYLLIDGSFVIPKVK
ncbi:hypothetical protein [Petroclostridium sp. X23]|nr:hypothetical protein [Petroclostridium sp. X23]WHH61106.1 hypothetical protein QKW49_10535 [Petroclostridium sp. X23]